MTPHRRERARPSAGVEHIQEKEDQSISGRWRTNSFRTLSGPVAFLTGNVCKVDESSWGVIAVLMMWPCEEGGNSRRGIGSGEPRTVCMLEARHSAFWTSLTRTPLLVNGKVTGD